MTKTVRRTELYDLVWSVPMKDLAPHFDISDVALAKRCKKADIPVPPRGYWARKQAGQKLSQPALPPRYPGAAETIRFGNELAYGISKAAEDEFLERVPKAPHFDEPIEAVRDRIIKLVGRVSGNTSLDAPHRHIDKILKAEVLRQQEKADTGWEWRGPLFTSRFEQRRLRVLNALFCAFEKAGAKPYVRGKEARGLHISIGDRGFEWVLDRPIAAAQEYYYPEVVKERLGEKPSDLLLRLKIWGLPKELTTSWQDSKDRELETQLTEIVQTTLLAAEVSYRAAEQHRYEWEIKRQVEIREERKKRAEEEARREQETQAKVAQKRIDTLFKDAALFRQAADIRAFVDAALDEARRHSTEPSSGILAWARWAREQANNLDPLASGKLARGFAEE